MNSSYVGTYAICLHQPFATLWVLNGRMGKEYETRHWPIKLHQLPRRVVVHAAMRWDCETREFCQTKEVLAALWHYRDYLAMAWEASKRELKDASGDHWGYVPLTHSWGLYLPRGCYIGAGVITDCIGTDGMKPSKLEQHFGNFTPGRYAWNLEHRVRLNYTPAEGRRKWWRVQQELSEAAF